MFEHVCSKCQAVQTPDEVKNWGRTPESSGYGPIPKCIRIVPDPITKAGAVCGGVLVLMPAGTAASVAANAGK